MKQPAQLPLAADMTAFDLEGILFANFTADDYLSGKARQKLEAMIRASGDAYIDRATILTAFSSARQMITREMPPWIIEERRIKEVPETAKRFKPYWLPNGGTHRTDGTISCGLMRDSAELNTKNGEFVQKKCTHWDF